MVPTEWRSRPLPEGRFYAEASPTCGETSWPQARLGSHDLVRDPDFRPLLDSARTSGNFSDVGSLRAFLPLHDFKFDAIALLQRTVAVAADGGIVHEHVGPIFPADKAVTFRIVEPFDSPGDFQLSSSNGGFKLAVGPEGLKSRPHRLPNARECTKPEQAVKQVRG